MKLYRDLFFVLGCKQLSRLWRLTWSVALSEFDPFGQIRFGYSRGAVQINNFIQIQQKQTEG